MLNVVGFENVVVELSSQISARARFLDNELVVAISALREEVRRGARSRSVSGSSPNPARRPSELSEMPPAIRGDAGAACARYGSEIVLLEHHVVVPVSPVYRVKTFA